LNLRNREFRRSASGEKYKSYNTRTGGLGQVLYLKVFDLPSKKISLQKIFGFVFFNLSLQTREARGVAQNQWASHSEAQNNFPKSDLMSICVAKYTFARTYFTKNC